MAGRKTFRKVITSDELISQINPENIKLMERFLKNFATKRSPKSVTVYKSNLQIFFCWCVENLDNKAFKDLKKLNFLDFFDYALTELKWSPARFAQMASCLSSFSDWIETYMDDVEGYEDFRNIVKKVEKPAKEAVREKTVLQKEDIDKIFTTLEEDKKVQEQCLLALAISCGARVSELARFTIDLIDEDNTVFDGLFLKTTEKIKTKGRGTTGKMLDKFILKDMFLPYYKKWLPIREQIMKETGQEHDYIFITKDGNPANADRLRDWIGTWGDIVNQPSYPHMYRHYQISLLKKLEIDDDLIVYLTGWAEGTGHSMIAIYNDNSIADTTPKCLEKLKDYLEQENKEL